MNRMCAAITAIVVTIIMLAASPAAAAHASNVPARASASAASVRVAQEVRNLLKHNPGAVQISQNAIRYKGSIMGVGPSKPSGAGSAGAIVPDSASGVCPADWLCLFVNAGFVLVPGVPSGDEWIDFYSCNVNYNLTNYHMPNGTSWADQTSAIDYPGSADGHVARFNHKGDWWLSLYRDHYLANLTLNGGPNPQGNSNDWITGLYVC
jgi:hypothetical protein